MARARAFLGYSQVRASENRLNSVPECEPETGRPFKMGLYECCGGMLKAWESCPWLPSQRKNGRSPFKSWQMDFELGS